MKTFGQRAVEALLNAEREKRYPSIAEALLKCDNLAAAIAAVVDLFEDDMDCDCPECVTVRTLRDRLDGK